MRKKLIAEVSQEVIDDAQQRSSSHCMIAEAIRRDYPDAANISVDLQTIRLTDRKRKKRYVWLTPPLAQRALINFDQGLPAEPFTVVSSNPAQVYDAAVKEPGQTGGRRDRKRRVASGPSKGSIPTIVGGAQIPVGAIAGTSDVLPGGQVKQDRKREAVPSPEPAEVEANSNPSLKIVKASGRVRRFGLKQLRP